MKNPKKYEIRSYTTTDYVVSHGTVARQIVAHCPDEYWAKRIKEALDLLDAHERLKKPQEMPNPVKGLQLSVYPIIKEH